MEVNGITSRVEYTLTEKGLSVVPILQSICLWSGAYHKEDSENVMQHCRKCDYKWKYTKIECRLESGRADKQMKQIMDLFLTFGRIGAFTFGGGYAMLSLLDYECVEKKKWLTADELMDVTVIAESTPGPIAINCATYTGYKLAGMKGALSATVGMVLPSFLLLFGVSVFFENILIIKIIEKAFRGIRIAVAVLIIQAAVKMIKKMMKKSPDKKIQMFLVIFFFVAVFTMNVAGAHISTVYLILCSGFLGLTLFGNPGNKKAGRDER